MRIKLIDSNIEIIRKLNNAAIKKVVKTFYNSTIIGNIETLVREEVLNSIKNTAVWSSLLNGGVEGLDAHFGIPRGEIIERLNTLLSIWAQEISVRPQNIKRRPRTFAFSYRFYAIRADWNAVLASPAGVTVNYSRRHQGQRLPWLEWLLVDGDQLTISDYHIEFGDFSKSRSGKAFMRPNFSWRIPPAYGPFNIANNFITRALDELAESVSFRKRIIDTITSVSFGKTTFSNVDDFDITSLEGLI